MNTDGPGYKPPRNSYSVGARSIIVGVAQTLGVSQSQSIARDLDRTITTFECMAKNDQVIHEKTYYQKFNKRKAPRKMRK